MPSGQPKRDIRYSSCSSAVSFSHSPALSRPVQDTAEMIESVEAHGWQMDKMTGIEWHDNITLICLFRRANPV